MINWKGKLIKSDGNIQSLHWELFVFAGISILLCLRKRAIQVKF